MSSTVVFVYNQRVSYSQAVYIRISGAGRDFDVPVRLFPSSACRWSCAFSLPSKSELTYSFFIALWDDPQYVLHSDEEVYKLSLQLLTKPFIELVHKSVREPSTQEPPAKFMLPLKVSLPIRISFGDALWLWVKAAGTPALPPLRLSWQEEEWVAELDLPDSLFNSSNPQIVFETHRAAFEGFAEDPRGLLFSHPMEVPNAFARYSSNFESERELLKMRLLLQPRSNAERRSPELKAILDNTLNLKNGIFSFHQGVFEGSLENEVELNIATSEVRLGKFYFSSIFEAFAEHNTKFISEPSTSSGKVSVLKAGNKTWKFVNNGKENVETKINLPPTDAIFELFDTSRELPVQITGMTQSRVERLIPKQPLALKVKDFEIKSGKQTTSRIRSWENLGIIVVLEPGEDITVKMS